LLLITKSITTLFLQFLQKMVASALVAWCNNSTSASTVQMTGGLRRTNTELAVGCLTFLVIMLMTIVGNVLVVLSIFTYKPLHKVQNYFMVSLAAADLSVALLVMPLHVVKFLVGK